MRNFTLALFALSLPGFAQQNATGTPETMTKMVVRLMGPEIRPGSFSALPKTIYRAGDRYARIEDPPDARQKIQKLTIIAGPDAYSVNVIDHKGTHATAHGSNEPRVPIVLPLDPRHNLQQLDSLEFGSEFDFFQATGATHMAGPVINAKATDAYELKTPSGPATLVVRGGTETPVTLSWHTKEGVYKYEYITYEELPFDRGLFAKPTGIQMKEIPPDPDAPAGTEK